jgi:hypothetical protein
MTGGWTAVVLARQHKVEPSGTDLSKMSKLAHRGWEFFFVGILGILISLCCIGIDIVTFLILLAISLMLLFISAVLLIIERKRKSKIVASDN